ncbi:MAG: DUF2383 domain-containing protein [Gemmatimonadota bacterium]
MANEPADRGAAGAIVESSEIIDGLNDLIRLDHDAIGAYEIAIDRLEDRDTALQIEGFKRDHERHIRDLNELVLGLGGTPANEPHATAPLKQAIQQVAAAAGDGALLMAWRANELQVMSKYDRYAQRAVGWPSDVKRTIDQNALDEERHYQWAAELTGDGDTPEVDLAARMREGMTRARLLTDEMQRRIGDGTEGDIRGAIENEIRANPARSLIATLVVGFILGRVLR